MVLPSARFWTRSLKLAQLRRPTYLLLLPLLAAGCAAQSEPFSLDPLLVEEAFLGSAPPNPDSPDVATVRKAFLRPILDTCDELVCYHYPSRLFSVRALECTLLPPRHAPALQEAQCRYERRLTTRPNETEGPWSKANTKFARRSDGSGWFVLSDLSITPP